MSAYLLVGLAVVAVAMAILVWNLKHAPKGYEDATGFHEGEEP
jgi:nitrogen fixation-related uncharacterized protein